MKTYSVPIFIRDGVKTFIRALQALSGIIWIDGPTLFILWSSRSNDKWYSLCIKCRKHLLTEFAFSLAPSQPPQNVTLNSTCSTCIKIAWSPPSHWHQNGVITSYLLKYWEKDFPHVARWERYVGKTSLKLANLPKARIGTLRNMDGDGCNDSP